LESIIIHFAKEELGFLTDQPIAEDDAYFKAVKLPDEAREETLRKLFDMSIAQLIDYSSINIEKGTPVSVIHFTTEKAALKSSAEYFSEQMNFSLSRSKVFRVVERKDMQKIIAELKLQSAGIIDDATAAKAGKLMGARMIFTGRVYEVGETYEIFMKMLRVETGEILSVNKLRIDSKLGLTK
jgi:TolB-like protein